MEEGDICGSDKGLPSWRKTFQSHLSYSLVIVAQSLGFGTPTIMVQLKALLKKEENLSCDMLNGHFQPEEGHTTCDE